jgi:hypothetical protein
MSKLGASTTDRLGGRPPEGRPTCVAWSTTLSARLRTRNRPSPRRLGAGAGKPFGIDLEQVGGLHALAAVGLAPFGDFAVRRWSAVSSRRCRNGNRGRYPFATAA